MGSARHGPRAGRFGDLGGGKKKRWRGEAKAKKETEGQGLGLGLAIGVPSTGAVGEKKLGKRSDLFFLSLSCCYGIGEWQQRLGFIAGLSI